MLFTEYYSQSVHMQSSTASITAIQQKDYIDVRHERHVVTLLIIKQHLQSIYNKKFIAGIKISPFENDFAFLVNNDRPWICLNIK